MTTADSGEPRHAFAGRASAAARPNMVTFCRCGLGFFGRDVQQADERLDEHVRAHPDGFITFTISPPDSGLTDALVKALRKQIRRKP